MDKELLTIENSNKVYLKKFMAVLDSIQNCSRSYAKDIEQHAGNLEIINNSLIEYDNKNINELFGKLIEDYGHTKEVLFAKLIYALGSPAIQNRKYYTIVELINEALGPKKTYPHIQDSFGSHHIEIKMLNKDKLLLLDPGSSLVQFELLLCSRKINGRYSITPVESGVHYNAVQFKHINQNIYEYTKNSYIHLLDLPDETRSSSYIFKFKYLN